MRFEFADCTVDLDGLQLRRGGVRVHLEPQVFDVLVYLLVHRDRVVPKAELLQQVWGDQFVTESALTSRIMAARRAVHDDGREQRIIRTAFGRGYQFVAEVRESASGAELPVLGALPGATTFLLPKLEQDIRFCQAPDGTRIAYAIAGNGPFLVKAANWMTHVDYDAENMVWRHWVADLSRAFTLVRYDERGCGMSDWNVDRIDFEAWVDDLSVVVDELGLDRFPLLGVSQGAAVAVAFAARYPERVSALVLNGSYARGRMSRAESPEARQEAALDVELARVGWARDDPSFRQVFTSQFLPDGSREEWAAFDELQRRTISPGNAVAFLETFAGIDVTDAAARVRCPTLILHARDDHRVPLSAARELAALIPGSRFVPLAGRNHLLTAAEPAWPLFLDELTRFLAPLDGADHLARRG
jgi:pimeloyl-ACP methyl ester carboxylesterase/DNA-binding winged helix-turn-helix (wHTH) protein